MSHGKAESVAISHKANTDSTPSQDDDSVLTSEKGHGIALNDQYRESLRASHHGIGSNEMSERVGKNK